VNRIVVVGYGVHAGHVPAVLHRALEQVSHAFRPVVIAEFLDRVPPIHAVDLSRDEGHAIHHSVRAVLTPQLHRGHQPVQRRVRPFEEPATACAPRLVLGARGAGHVSLHAQLVRWQRLPSTRVARHQPFDLRTQGVHDDPKRCSYLRSLCFYIC